MNEITRQIVEKIAKKLLARNQGLTFCRSEEKGKPKQVRTSRRYCPVCKLKIRGKNHDKGEYHQRALRKVG